MTLGVRLRLTERHAAAPAPIRENGTV